VGNEELYGDNVRGKIEQCLRVGDAEAAAAAREREEFRERFAETVAGLDLLVTPTVRFVAPPSNVDELEIRAGGIELTYPYSSLGWPGLALPCGRAEERLPASVQLGAPAGADGRVLAAGRLVADSLRRRP
jgi:aspartyl-tRNA(Asn)/glutamyl-tRNA(Gln) amidotransferase subunit A